MPEPRYDLIIAGMGCAGLSLAVQLSSAGLTKNQRILLVDREYKNTNNRTWCFWESQPGFFEEIIYSAWDNAWFHCPDFSSLLHLAPYSYKMIRGLDFYEHCIKLINSDPAFEIIRSSVQSVRTVNGEAVCETDNGTYYAPFLFNSILFENPHIAQGEYYLMQHFKGWVIRTAKPAFDPLQATLMDFRVSQDRGTTFVYVMPFSANEALVEYTLFSSTLLDDKSYENGLTDYINDRLKLSDWRILEDEHGVIPMTNHLFPRRQGSILNIGTAGGMTKGSSGYTFRFIQKDTAAIVDSIRKTGSPFNAYVSQPRFQWYDSVLLNILSRGTVQGAAIFADLFQNNQPQKILKFLDNETSVSEELRILLSLPQWPFMKAGIQEGLKRLV
jgi:lycopene beta-cyclase